MKRRAAPRNGAPQTRRPSLADLCPGSAPHRSALSRCALQRIRDTIDPIPFIRNML